MTMSLTDQAVLECARIRDEAIAAREAAESRLAAEIASNLELRAKVAALETQLALEVRR